MDYNHNKRSGSVGWSSLRVALLLSLSQVLALSWALSLSGGETHAIMG
jgi:hypothetical protein